MATAEFRVVGVENLLKRFEQFTAEMQSEMMVNALKGGGQIIHEAVRNSAPTTEGRKLQYRVKGNRLVRIPGSGNLKKSVKLSMSKRKLQATIRTRAFYGRFIEYGTGRHLIKAKKGGALSFLGIFRDEVWHPGIRPNPFMRRGYDASERLAIEEIKRRLRNSIRYTSTEFSRQTTPYSPASSP